MRKKRKKVVDDFKTIVLNNGKIMKVDVDDYEKLSQHKWGINSSGYARRTISSKKNKCSQATLLAHRLIMNFPQSGEIDHINNDKLDNRKANLRIVDRHINLSNRTLNRIEYDKKSKQYYPRIVFYGKRFSMGSFRQKQKAERVAKSLYNFLWNKEKCEWPYLKKHLDYRLSKPLNRMTKASALDTYNSLLEIYLHG